MSAPTLLGDRYWPAAVQTCHHGFSGESWNHDICGIPEKVGSYYRSTAKEVTLAVFGCHHYLFKDRNKSLIHFVLEWYDEDASWYASTGTAGRGAGVGTTPKPVPTEQTTYA